MFKNYHIISYNGYVRNYYYNNKLRIPTVIMLLLVY